MQSKNMFTPDGSLIQRYDTQGSTASGCFGPVVQDYSNVEDNSDILSSNSSCVSSDSEAECSHTKDKLMLRYGSVLSHNKLNFEQFVQSSDIRNGYDRSRWIKATYDKQTKRFLDPPRDIEKLIKLFVSKFGVLRNIASQIKQEEEYKSLNQKLSLMLYDKSKDGPITLIQDSNGLAKAFDRSLDAASQSVLHLRLRVVESEHTSNHFDIDVVNERVKTDLQPKPLMADAVKEQRMKNRNTFGVEEEKQIVADLNAGAVLGDKDDEFEPSDLKKKDTLVQMSMLEDMMNSTQEVKNDPVPASSLLTKSVTVNQTQPQDDMLGLPQPVICSSSKSPAQPSHQAEIDMLNKQSVIDDHQDFMHQSFQLPSCIEPSRSSQNGTFYVNQSMAQN